MNILITSGATREPIDGVRFITNFSTGATGARLAEELLSLGHGVMLVAGEGAVLPERPCELVRYGSFQDLDAKLRAVLSARSFDWILHLAAVGDYSVDRIETEAGRMVPMGQGKLDSAENLMLRLKRNFKILERLRAYAAPAPSRIVGFKLTNTEIPAERQAAVEKLLDGSDVDLVVHNDLGEIAAGRRVFTVFSELGRRGQASSEPELIRIMTEELR